MLVSFEKDCGIACTSNKGKKCSSNHFTARLSKQMCIMGDRSGAVYKLLDKRVENCVAQWVKCVLPDTYNRSSIVSSDGGTIKTPLRKKMLGNADIPS